MSRRFGRNQKRRMREALEVEVQRVEATARLATDRLHMWQRSQHELTDLQYFFESVAELVGRESVLVGGEVDAELIGPDVRQFRAAVRSQFPATWMPNIVPTRESVKSEIMHRLQVEAVRSSLSQHIVARCYLGDKEVGIALSETLIMRSTEEELIKRIAPELARGLARAIKEAK